METRNIPLCSLHPNTGQIDGVPKNPRFIRDEKFAKLRKSIEDDPEMLELRELGVYESRPGYYVVLLGNMRLRAMKDLGYKDAPCKIIPQGTDAKKLRAYTVKDNVSYGDNDWDIMANEWDATELMDWGMDLPTEWEDGSNIDTEDHQAKEDDFDEENETIVCRCKKGDIWQCGNHRVMCGDSTDAADVALLTDGIKMDMVFTDPPYNVNYEDKNKYLNSFRINHRVIHTIENDSKDSDEEAGEKVWKPAFVNMIANAKDCCSIYVTMPQGGAHMMMMMMMRAGWQVKHELIWNKNNHVLGRTDYYYKHEPICFGWNKKHKFYGKGEFDKSVWDIPKPLKSDLHPTMKPIALIENALLNSSADGDSILDLFGGSGSTLIACEQLNRKCYMMELDPHYCDVILARWEKLTGRTAEKLTGE